MTYDIISVKDFEALPTNQPVNKADEFWQPLMAAIADNKIVKVPFSDEKEKKGRRLAAGRRAKKAGFAIELRYGDGFLAIKRRA